MESQYVAIHTLGWLRSEHRAEGSERQVATAWMLAEGDGTCWCVPDILFTSVSAAQWRRVHFPASEMGFL